MKRFAQISITFIILISLFIPSGLEFAGRQIGGVKEAQAAEPVDFAIITDYGYVSTTTEAVAAMVHGWGPDFIVTAGDNHQGTSITPNGYQQVVGNYYGTGAPAGRDYISDGKFWPVPGNHDYYVGITNYTNFFNYLPPNPNEGQTGDTALYYDFVRGPVHFFMMDSGQTDGIAPPNWDTQTAWLEAGLKASTTDWQIVVMHRPPYTGGTYHPSDVNLQLDYAEWGADFVIAGHNHIYERIPKMEGTNGDKPIVYYTAGAAGSDVRSGTQIGEFLYSGSGAMRFEATNTSMKIEYVPVNTGSAIDTKTYTKSAPQVTYAWEAYVDCAFTGTHAANPTNTLVKDCSLDSGAISNVPLKDFSNGTELDALLSVSVSNSGVAYNTTSDGTITATGTDAYATFGDPLVPAGYKANTVGNVILTNNYTITLTLSGLTPGKSYTFATTTNRNGTDVGSSIYSNRYTTFTLAGADSAINASTEQVVGSTNTITKTDYVDGSSSTTFRSGNNTTEGYVARWENILPGEDGTITITASKGGDGTTYYGPAVFMLAQEGDPLPTYTLSTSTVGDGSVTLNPLGGTYTEGTTVTLTAVPATGFAFDSWSGDMTSSTNPATITMDADKTVTANFVVSQCFDLVFQEGSGGYASTVDTYIMQDEPTTPHGGEAAFGWDNDDPRNTGHDNFGLLRFDNIFGAGTNQIPLGSTIETATLTYVVSDTGDAADVNEVAIDWAETVTYDTFGTTAGVQTGDYGPSVGSAAAATTGAKTLNVQTSLQRWAGGTTNYGWIFRPTGSGGVDVRSSEYTTATQRPKLEVRYCLASTDPTIIVTPDALSFYALPSTLSGVKTYTVSGYNLTDNITITPSTADFEISTDGVTFTNSSITLTQTGGIVSETPIYVRMQSLAIGTYSRSIGHTSGALEETVSLTGVVSNSYLGMVINGDIPKTGSQQVILDMSFGGATPTTMRFANVDPNVVCSTVTSWSTPEAYSPTASWTLSGTADGTYKVCAQASLNGTDYTLSAEDTIDLDVGYITENPNLDASCGLDIVLVIDLSSSIDRAGALQTYQDALMTFVTALKNTPTNLSIVTFNLTAQVLDLDPNTAGVQDWVRLSSTNATTINGIIDALTTGTGTNWDDAMRKARLQFEDGTDPSDAPDMIVFATDGDPSTWGGHDGDTTPTPGGQYDTMTTYAIPEAEEAKAAGIHMLGLGIGIIGDSVDRLQAISGTDLFVPNPSNITTADYYVSTDFSTLTAALEDLVISLCGGSVTINKVITDSEVDRLNPDNWDVKANNRLLANWTFIADVTSSYDTLDDIDTKTTNDSGNVNFKVDMNDEQATLSVVEDTEKEEYSFVGAVCFIDEVEQTVAYDTGTRSVTGIPVLNEKLTSCTFVNFLPYDPTGVVVGSFEAISLPGGVLLTWETESDFNTLGFNLYRATTQDGERERLNSELIPTQTPGVPLGAVYTFFDPDVIPGETYYYWLEVVESDQTGLNNVIDTLIIPNFWIYTPLITR